MNNYELKNTKAVREQIKQKPIGEALQVIDNSSLTSEQKYRLMKELYRVRCVEFDSNFRKNGISFDEWVRDDIDDWVGCFWPGDIQCDELEKYIYDDFLNNYLSCDIDIFAEDYGKIKKHNFKYFITKLIFEQILAYPKIIKSFCNITEDEIWNSLQWLIYSGKIDSEDSLINYKGE